MTKHATKAKSNVTPINATQRPKIEKGVPLPTRSNHWSYLAAMSKGDSVFISEKMYNVDSAVNSIRSLGYTNDITFTVRKVEGGARVRRV